MGRGVLYMSRTPEQPTQKKKKSYKTHKVVERREGYNMYTGLKGLFVGGPSAWGLGDAEEKNGGQLATNLDPVSLS